MLTPEQQGMLVCDALNRLPQYDDTGHLPVDADKCCPDCCAPCGLLRDLLDAETLDEIIQQGPEHLWRDVAWATEGMVNQQWLLDCWECTSRPRCDDPGMKAEIFGLLGGLGDRIREDRP